MSLTKSETISISKGNMKLINIASFSLPPVLSCLNHTHCAAKCYAKKAYQAYPNTKNAYDRNFNVVKNDMDSFENQMDLFLSKYKYKYFRIHVSGDFYSQEYLNTWIRIVSKYPKIKFLAFTKVYYFDYTKAPANLSIVFSTFDTMPTGTDTKLKEKYSRPIARAGADNPDKKLYRDCPGSCSTCKYCWNVKTKNVFFHYH